MPHDAVLENLVLDRSSGIPLYVQIRDGLRRVITSGEIASGTTLPAEHELSRALHISRMTVRNALADLEREGLIRRAQGVGTVVSFPHFRHELKAFTSFTEDIRARGMVPGSRILGTPIVPAPEAVAAALQVEPGEPVLCIRRLRLASGKPAGIHEAYLRPSDIDPKALDEFASLYELLERNGIALWRAGETLEAIPASTEEARLLHLPAGAPLLQVIRTTIGRRPPSPREEPIEYVVAKYRPDVYRYTVSLSRSVRRRSERHG